ncbi:MAG: type II secretion system protein N [Burkholderiaceae bacterium]|nr:type II secretion system protein N [Burkholderiaceae bacterium]
MKKPWPRPERAAMLADHNRRMASRLFALIVWALVAGSLVFWGLRLFAQAAPSPTPAVASSDLMASQGDLTRLFGAAPVAPPVDVIEALAPDVSARFRLTGVMAPKRPSEQGLAVISVDGNPARVYRVGALIEGEWVLREVSLRTATVASAQNVSDPATSFVLELPLVAIAATGVLPPALSVTVPSGVVLPTQTPRSMTMR